MGKRLGLKAEARNKKKIGYVRTSSIQNKMLKEKYPPVLNIVSIVLEYQ